MELYLISALVPPGLTFLIETFDETVPPAAGKIIAALPTVTPSSVSPPELEPDPPTLKPPSPTTIPFTKAIALLASIREVTFAVPVLSLVLILENIAVFVESV